MRVRADPFDLMRRHGRAALDEVEDARVW